MDPMDPMDPSKASILSSCVLDEMDEMGEKERESDTAELAEVFLNFYVFFRWLTVRQVTERQGFPTGSSLGLQRRGPSVRQSPVCCPSWQVGTEHNGWVWLGDAWHVKTDGTASRRPTATAFCSH